MGKCDGIPDEKHFAMKYEIALHDGLEEGVTYHIHIEQNGI